MRLSRFIEENLEPILQAWEDFARTIVTPNTAMNATELRDHAALMLQTIITDLDQPQTLREQARKSMGLGQRIGPGDTYAEIHAEGRLESGYTINQLVSEYRALRASVLSLWARAVPAIMLTDPDDMTRFNESIDLALAESVARYSAIVRDDAISSQRRLEAILEAAPVGIRLVDAQGAVTMANDRNAHIWGHPGPSSIADFARWNGWWADGSARHGERIALADWPVAQALSGIASAQGIIEIERINEPGVRRTVLAHATPVYDEGNSIVGAVVAQMDITGQVRAETALSESEAKFKTIANAMPQMVWSTRPDGFHDYFNQQWHAFTGTPKGSTDGEAWNGLFHPEDQEYAWEKWRTSLATGADYEIQYRLRHHSGSYRWVLGRALAIRDDTGQITRWMGTCTDIHDQKMAEQRLHAESERKDEFLAMLAHELRNPLAPIASAAQILHLMGGDQHRVEQAGAVITRQVGHMTNLVDDLLDVSRVTRGLVMLDLAVADLKIILASAIEQVRPALDARHHELIVRLAPGVVLVKADKTRLVQVIANLLSNAAKYTPVGGKIVVSMRASSETVQLAVLDNGTGIAPALLPHVFDLFTQGERTPDRIQGGLGLGLALVKSLVHLHGGTVTAASDGPGMGSNFTLELPSVADEAPLAPTVEPAPLRAANATLRIMVVDDNLDAAQALSALLTYSGHQVTVHESGMAVLRDIGRYATDVFILDIGLPGMDGHALARQLRDDRATSGALIVALTGYGQAQDRDLALAAGFDRHFVKPIDFSALASLLSQSRSSLGN